MRITDKKLDQMLIDLARYDFGGQPFARHELMSLAEDKIRKAKQWEDGEDDKPSGSSNPKSKGLARIDYRFTPLKKTGRLWNITHGFWMYPLEDFFMLGESGGTTKRVLTTSWRIVRDTVKVTKLKTLYADECQLCRQTLKLGQETYSEGHHLKPLGFPHNGPDDENNILILCPNCHVQFDFGAVEFGAKPLRFKRGHKVSNEYIEYYERKIYRKP